jgi:hypothetical protein
MSFMNIFMWKAGSPGHHILRRSKVDCRLTILTGACVKVVHACNSMIGLLLGSFSIEVANSDFNVFAWGGIIWTGSFDRICL